VPGVAAWEFRAVAFDFAGVEGAVVARGFVVADPVATGWAAGARSVE
jgi:hypothetical protein